MNQSNGMAALTAATNQLMTPAIMVAIQLWRKPNLMGGTVTTADLVRLFEDLRLFAVDRATLEERAKKIPMDVTDRAPVAALKLLTAGFMLELLNSGAQRNLEEPSALTIQAFALANEDVIISQ